MHHFWHIRLYYFMEGKNATGTQRFVQCGEGAVTDRTCQKWFVKFVLEVSHWTMLHSWADQLKLIVIKSRR